MRVTQAAGRAGLAAAIILAAPAAGVAQTDEAPLAAAGTKAATDTKGLVDPGQGGIAGTGLGKMPPDAGSAGTGNSVPGPPGQGIGSPPTTGTAAKPGSP